MVSLHDGDTAAGAAGHAHAHAHAHPHVHAHAHDAILALLGLTRRAIGWYCRGVVAAAVAAKGRGHMVVPFPGAAVGVASTLQALTPLHDAALVTTGAVWATRPPLILVASSLRGALAACDAAFARVAAAGRVPTL